MGNLFNEEVDKEVIDDALGNKEDVQATIKVVEKHQQKITDNATQPVSKEKPFLQRFIEVQVNLTKKISKNAKIERSTTSNGKSFGGYRYFSNEDILPAILEECAKAYICTFFSPSPEQGTATLIIADTLSDERLTFKSSLFKFGNGSEGQQIAGGYTYIKRQLFILAFNIVENDNLEEQEVEKIKKAHETKKKTFEEKKNMVFDVLASDIETQTKALEHYNVKTIDDLKKKEIEECYKQFLKDGRI